MEYFCHSCNAVVSLIEGKAGRKDTCDSCDADLHACLNCRFHDASAYNECSEPNAERVLEKDRSNFCDYFEFRTGKGSRSGSKANEKADALKKLDDLFK